MERRDFKVSNNKITKSQNVIIISDFTLWFFLSIFILVHNLTLLSSHFYLRYPPAQRFIIRRNEIGNIRNGILGHK